MTALRTERMAFHTTSRKRRRSAGSKALRLREGRWKGDGDVKIKNKQHLIA